jgi:hypothetical protein
MDTQTPLRQPAQYVPPGNLSFPAPPDGHTDAPSRPIAFTIFAIVVIGGAAIGGLFKSGKLKLDQFFHTAKPVAVQAAAPIPHSAPAAPPKPGAFVVTSISLAQPSYAIINGVSHTEGDPVEAPGAPGWKLNRILDGAVWLQNGSTVVAIPLTTPGIKPLDDELHPLN